MSTRQAPAPPAPPPPQPQSDFTAEGSPPPGKVGSDVPQAKPPVTPRPRKVGRTVGAR